MQYKDMLKQYEDSCYIINMIPIEGLLKTGLSLGLNADSAVLDLCCGYGTLLKVWGEAFGVMGTGIDLDQSFIQTGKERLLEAGVKGITLLAEDALAYESTEKYDVVSCSETLGSAAETFALMERHLKPGGKLVCNRLFTKVPNPPKELTDFDGPLPTLDECYERFRGFGYYVSNIASDDRFTWDHYISWSARRDLDALRRNQDDERSAQWLEKWYHMYFTYRRPCEGMAMFVLERL